MEGPPPNLSAQNCWWKIFGSQNLADRKVLWLQKQHENVRNAFKKDIGSTTCQHLIPKEQWQGNYGMDGFTQKIWKIYGKKEDKSESTLNWSMATETNACLLKNQYFHNLLELTYPPLPKHYFYEDDFPFSKVVYVSSLEGMCCLENLGPCSTLHWWVNWLAFRNNTSWLNTAQGRFFWRC